MPLVPSEALAEVRSAYREVRTIAQGGRFLVLRAQRIDDGRAVVLKTISQGHADERSGELLRREYELLRRLDVRGVTRPLALAALNGAATMVLEDAGPRNLGERLGGRPLPVDAFFDLAVEMASIVGALHRSNVIHRDLCPENFVLDDGGRPTLVDFEVATHVPAFVARPDLVGDLAGTLGYIAPEQTGRMQRLVDARADLYSLGAIFYEMLTGAPPFASRDPLELVHAHVARTPFALAAINPAVPAALSDLVLKLLAKAPEARYQSADSVAADLAEMLRQWRARREVTRFELARYDVPYGLFLRGRLYGRDRERAALVEALARVRAGAREIVLVTGRAGIGKSALVDELRHAATSRLTWLTGKCDLLRGNLPYAPIIDACAMLAEALRDEPEDTLAALRAGVREAIAPNGRILAEVIPPLAPLLGEHPPVAEAGPGESENRFRYTFVTFVRAVASRRPVVLFLDDLQWADPASLNLLQALATAADVRSLLVVGAFRGEEVGPAHPVTRVLEAVQNTGTSLTRLDLPPLDSLALRAFLSDVLRATPEEVQPLADVLERKTGSNPFFVRRFLRHLGRVGLLEYQPEEGRWHWDLARIARAEVTENVGDLLIGAVRALPAQTQRVLEVAACMGGSFLLTTLAAAVGRPVDDVAAALWAPLDDGILLPTDQGRRSLVPATTPLELHAARTPSYRFAHDRIQQAVYHLLDATTQQQTHYRIGHELLRALVGDAVGDSICPIVDQLNRAIPVGPASERLYLAELNHQAGCKARADAAYASALAYYRQGMELLPPEAWREKHTLWFALLRDAAECAVFSGEHLLAQSLIDAGLAHAQTPLEKGELFGIAIQSDTIRGAFQAAIDHGLAGLGALGIELAVNDLDASVEAERRRVHESLGGRVLSMLADAPPLDAPLERVRLKLLIHLFSPAWFLERRLYLVVVFRAVTLTLKVGLAADTPYVYASYAVALALDERYADAYEAGRHALHLLERRPSPNQECRTLVVLAATVNPWRVSLSQGLSLVRRSHALGIQSGEIEYALWARASIVHQLFYAGNSLDELLAETEATLAQYRALGHQAGAEQLQPMYRAARFLRGLANSYEGTEPAPASPYMLAHEHLVGIICAYVLGDLGRARAHAGAGVQAFNWLRGHYAQAWYHFYSALVAAASWPTAGPEARGALVSEIHAHLGRLAVWAENAPANFQHKHDLVAAELAWIDDRHGQALALYDRAIAGAHREGYQPEAALCHERCGRFHLSRGEEQFAKLHLEAVLERYDAWGAATKVAQLREEFGAGLRIGRRLAHGSPTAAPPLDYLSLLKVAEAVAGELEFDRLAERMLRVGLETASAERVALVLDEDRGLVVRASASVSNEVMLERTPLERARALPASLLQHVHQSGRTLVLSDAARAGAFASDPDVAARSVRSVLAVPLRRAEHGVGVLYFENNLASDAFAPARVQMLDLLSSQLAVALANSRLFEERRRAETALRFLAEASRELTRSLDYATTLARVARLAVPALADWCVVDLEQGGRFARVASAHVDPSQDALLGELARRYPLGPESPHPAARALRARRAYLVPEVTDEVARGHTCDASHAALVSSLGTRSVLAVPLIAHGRTLGAITLAASRPSVRYGPADVALAEDLARRVALAIENARLYSELQRANESLEAQVAARTAELERTLGELWSEMDLARKIQTVLLPPDAVRGGYDIAAEMRPAAVVGGDYYDAFSVGSAQWVLIGDVSGHGVAAGLIMMMVQTAVRALVIDHDESAAPLSPASVVAKANAAVRDNLRRIGGDQYMTLMALRIDADGAVAYAGLHQNVTIYRAATGAIESSETKGAWLGVLDDINALVADQSLRLARGDVLLLHTDGLTEARRGGQLVGLGPASDAFRQAAADGATAGSIVARVLDEALAGCVIADDVTVLVVRRQA